MIAYLVAWDNDGQEYPEARFFYADSRGEAAEKAVSAHPGKAEYRVYEMLSDCPLEDRSVFKVRTLLEEV